MSKRRHGTTEEELQDAIRRIGSKPEARQSVKNSKVWHDYLIEILGIHPEAVESEKGQQFWNDVRRGIQEKEPLARPTQRQILEANAEVYTNPRTEQVSYRNKETGRFVSVKTIVS